MCHRSSGVWMLNKSIKMIRSHASDNGQGHMWMVYKVDIAYSFKQTWVKIQNLMGRLDRYSMTKRVKRFRIEHLTLEAAEKSGKLLQGLELDDVEPVSNVAATLFAWVSVRFLTFKII